MIASLTTYDLDESLAREGATEGDRTTSTWIALKDTSAIDESLRSESTALSKGQGSVRDRRSALSCAGAHVPHLQRGEGTPKAHPGQAGEAELPYLPRMLRSEVAKK